MAVSNVRYDRSNDCNDILTVFDNNPDKTSPTSHTDKVIS